MNKVKLGFIGCGWWATVNHMPHLKQRADVEFTAVCGLDEAVLAKAHALFGFRYTTTDYRDLLRQDLDAVIVTSPHRLHFEHAKAALERGLHVMCEKPMALHAYEAWELVNTARAHDRVLLVPYGWNYKPFVQMAKQWVDEGGIGTIEYVVCQMASPTKDFFAGRGGVPASWKPTIAKPDLSTWQVKDFGGGYGHGQVTHSAALLFWLTGLRAREVTCRVGSPHSGVDMYDAAIVQFTNGALGVVSGAATLPDNDKFQIDLRVFGTKGVLLVDFERERLELRAHDGNHRSYAVPEGEGAYSCEKPPHVFIDLVRGSGRNDSSGEVAARSVELIDAMHCSADTGKPVRCEVLAAARHGVGTTGVKRRISKRQPGPSGRGRKQR
jgi:predicted dehydrogenase